MCVKDSSMNDHIIECLQPSFLYAKYLNLRKYRHTE